MVDLEQLKARATNMERDAAVLADAPNQSHSGSGDDNSADDRSRQNVGGSLDAF
jgi:hypothetical protein